MVKVSTMAKISFNLIYILVLRLDQPVYGQFRKVQFYQFTSTEKGRGFEPLRRDWVVSLSKNINPSLVLVQPRKTPPFITERLLMDVKNQNKQTNKTSTEIS